MTIAEYAALLAEDIRTLEHARKSAVDAEFDRLSRALGEAWSRLDSFVEFAGAMFHEGAERM